MWYNKSMHDTESAIQDRMLRTWCSISNKGFVGKSTRVYAPGSPAEVKSSDKGITWDGNGRAYWHQCIHDEVFEEKNLPSVEWEYNETMLDNSFPGWRNWPDGYARYDEFCGEVYLQRLPSGSPAGRFDIPTDSAYKPGDPSVHRGELDWGTAYEQVMNDAAGLMPDDISIGVNIAEFSSLKRLVPGLARNIRSILRYVQGHPNKTVRRYRYLFDKKTGKRIPWTASLETVKLRSLSWSLRDLASLNLGFNFGVLPLADDVSNWAQKLFQLQQHLNWYSLLTNGKSHWLRAKASAISNYTKTSQMSWEDRIGGVATWESGIYTELTGILHQKVFIQAKQSNAKYNALLAQVLGLNVPLQLAWDLVPFSFVVDWFLPVGKAISRIEPKRAFGSLAKRIVIEDTWYSLQGEERYQAQITSYRSNSTQRDIRLLSPGLTQKGRRIYRRLHESPAYNLLPLGKVRFGGRQFILSLSLLAQRLFSRR